MRAGLVERAEAWPWSSLLGLTAPEQWPARLEPGTVPRGTLWVEGVNAVTADIDMAIIRQSVCWDRPFGTSGPGCLSPLAVMKGLASTPARCQKLGPVP